MLLKKELLFNMIENGEVRSFTILGKPKEDLKECYFSNKDLIKFFKSKNIQCNTFEFDRTDIGVYFPSFFNKQYKDICSITINRVVNREEYDCILNLFDEIYDYYQTDIPPRIINKILNLYQGEYMVFSDMLMLIPDSQAEIARKINKSRQIISDIKSEKSKLTLENLSLLFSNYPLLPWDEFIRDICKNG